MEKLINLLFPTPKKACGIITTLIFTLMNVCLFSTCVSAIFVNGEFVDKAFWFSQLCDNVRGGELCESRQPLMTDLSRNTKKERTNSQRADSVTR